MFRHKLLAWVVPILLLAGPAFGATATWDVVPGSEAGDCSFTRLNTCFIDLDGTPDNSTTINTSMCENWSFHWVSNIALTTHLNSVNVRWSVSATASANTSAIVNNTELDGDPSTDTDVLAGYDAVWVYIDEATWNTGTGRGSLQCFKRRW